MEFCPHCGLHLQGHREFCRHCGPQVCWWFTNRDIVDKLGLTEEDSWRDENGEVHPRGWERKEDGQFHPFSWIQGKKDGKYYPHDWVLNKDGFYVPPSMTMA